MDYHTQEVEFLPVHTSNRSTVKVTCHVAGDTGLAYNVPAGGYESIGFVITHLASLKFITPSPMDTEYEVKLLLESIADLTDWHQSGEEISKLSIGAEIMSLQADIAEQVNQKILATAKDSGMPAWLVEEVVDEITEDGDLILRKALIYALKIVD